MAAKLDRKEERRFEAEGTCVWWFEDDDEELMEEAKDFIFF